MKVLLLVTPTCCGALVSSQFHARLLLTPCPCHVNVILNSLCTVLPCWLGIINKAYMEALLHPAHTGSQKCGAS